MLPQMWRRRGRRPAPPLGRRRGCQPLPPAPPQWFLENGLGWERLRALGPGPSQAARCASASVRPAPPRQPPLLGSGRGPGGLTPAWLRVLPPHQPHSGSAQVRRHLPVWRPLRALANGACWGWHRPHVLEPPPRPQRGPSAACRASRRVVPQRLQHIAIGQPQAHPLVKEWWRAVGRALDVVLAPHLVWVQLPARSEGCAPVVLESQPLGSWMESRCARGSQPSPAQQSAGPRSPL